MKTILWATLTANGNYAQSSAEHPPRPQTLADFAAQATAAGNFIVGRRTFEAFQANNNGGGGPAASLASLDLVVVSTRLEGLPVRVVRSPAEALAYLAGRGHATALLAGGAALHNAFLGAGLVDEVVFNVAPVMEGKGLNLVLDTERYRYQDVQLIDSRALGGGVQQSRFVLGRV